MSYYYLASPYSHPDPAVRERRYAEAIAASAWLFQRNLFNYSPIVSCHPLSVHHAMPGDAEFWRAFDQTMIRYCSSMVILQTQGWRESVGLKWEIDFANSLGIKIIGMQVLATGGFKLA